MRESNKPIFPSEDPTLQVESAQETHTEGFGCSIRIPFGTFFSIFPKKYASIINLIAKFQLEKIKFKSDRFLVNERPS